MKNIPSRRALGVFKRHILESCEVQERSTHTKHYHWMTLPALERELIFILLLEQLESLQKNF